MTWLARTGIRLLDPARSGSLTATSAAVREFCYFVNAGLSRRVLGRLRGGRRVCSGEEGTTGRLGETCIGRADM